jgi:dihydroflavonol-4-reductase
VISAVSGWVGCHGIRRIIGGPESGTTHENPLQLTGPHTETAHEPILVTGATGAIGGEIARLLAERGANVRAMARPGSDRSFLGNRVEWVNADVRNPVEVNRAVEGCSVIYHCAGFVGPTHYRVADFESINVLGTRNVIDAAVASGVSRVVHTSSIAALGGHGGERVDETMGDGEVMDGYAHSKRESERIAMAANRRGVEAISVNPAVVYGPRERYFSRIIALHVRGWLKIGAYPHRNLSLAYITDVATAHLMAMEQGRAGERYIVCGQSVTLSDFLHALSRVSGLREPMWTAPDWLVKAAFGIGWATAPIIRRRPPLRLSDLSDSGPTYDGAKSSRDLGLEYTPLDDGLSATIDWLRA